MTLIVQAKPIDAYSIEHSVIEGVDSASIVAQAIERASVAWVGKVGEDVVAIWGIETTSLLSRNGYLWLTTTPKIERFQFVFVKESRRFIEAASKNFDLLYGIVDDRFDLSKRWLQWLGFSISAPVIHNEVPICRFEKRYR